MDLALNNNAGSGEKWQTYQVQTNILDDSNSARRLIAVNKK